MSKANSGHIVIKSDDNTQIVTGSKAIADRLAHTVCAVLQQKYPDYPWHVQIGGDHSVVGIRCLFASGTFGYILHTNHIQHDPKVLEMEVMRAGGEILERANLVRGRGTGEMADGIITEDAKFKLRSHGDYVRNL